MKNKGIVTLLILVLLLTVAGPGLPGKVAANGADYVLPAPTDLTAVAVAGTQVDLTWNYDFETARDRGYSNFSFAVERSIAGGGAYSPIYFLDASTGSETGVEEYSFSDVNLSPGTAYYYKVKVSANLNNGGDKASEYSNAVYAAIPQAAPAVPSNLRARAETTTQINLSWIDHADNEEGFEIERKVEGKGNSFEKLTAVGENVTVFADTNISTGKIYSYRVRSYKMGSGVAVYSDYSNEASSPAAPSKLSAEAVYNNRYYQVNLTWQINAGDAQGFVVERKKGNEGFTSVATVENVTAFADKDLAAGTTYTYRVKAISYSQGSFISGESLYSNEISVSVGNSPAVPSNLEAVPVSTTEVQLTWKDNADNETGFKIEMKKSGGKYTEIATVGANVTSYAQKKLSANTTYYYRVRAYNTAGESGYSNEAQATTSPPAAPGKLQITTVSGSRLRLSWTDNSTNEAGFLIERKKKGGSYSQIDKVSANTVEYLDTGLAADTTYYYRVRAYNTVGNSGYSNEANAVTTFIAAPSNFTATTVSTSRIKLSWKDNANNETGFKIERKKSGGSYAQIATVKANVESYEDTGLTNKTTYYYRVRAYNAAAANSEYSNEAGATTGELPAAPTNLSAATLSNKEIRLTWRDEADNETGFKIERKKAGGSYSQIATVGRNVLSYTDAGPTSGVTYYYRVKAYNAAGESAYSNEVEATAGIPAAPSKLRAAGVTFQQVKLTWADNSGNESGFKIERKKAGGSFSQVATVGADLVSYTDSSLTAETTYYYRVRAYNAAGNSAYTDEIKVASAKKQTVMLLNVGKTGYFVDGKGKTMDVAPLIKEGRTLLPIRYLAEVIGAGLEWDPVVRKVTVAMEGKIIELWIGNPTARVNKISKMIDSQNKKVMPLIVPPGRTMLPLRFIAENLGCQVEWDHQRKEVKITYPASGV